MKISNNYNVKFFPSWIAGETGYESDDYYSRILSNKQDQSSYARVPLVFRALNMRCNTLNRVPVYIYRARTEVEEYPFEEQFPLKELLWLSEASILMTGANYLVQLQNMYGYEKGLQWLNPTTMRIKLNESGEKLFWQEIDGKRFPDSTGYWTEEDLLYWAMFNPANDLGGGVSAMSVAMGNSDLQNYTTLFLSRFFKNGAMPVTMAMLPAGSTDTQIKEVETRFKKILNGVKNAFRIVGVKGEVKFEKLTPEIKSFEIDKLNNYSIDNIAWAFDIPRTLLTADSANRATAETEYRNFISNTIEARCAWYQQRLNRFLKQYNFRIEFAPQEMTEMREDENQRSAAFKNYVDAGLSKQLTAAILGVDIPEDFESFWTEKEEEPQPEDTTGGNGQQVDEKLEEEKQKWYRKSLARLRSKHNAQCEFLSDYIPQETKIKIFDSLKDVQNDVELKKLFEAIKQ